MGVGNRTSDTVIAYGLTAFQQEQSKVRWHGFGAKLLHHQPDLTAVVRGMIGQMLQRLSSRRTSAGDLWLMISGESYAASERNFYPVLPVKLVGLTGRNG